MPEPPAPTPGPEPLDLAAGVHKLCSCGRSHHGLFCDGAHLGTRAHVL
jgi:CDGSH-type Zn-finger protein